MTRRLTLPVLALALAAGMGTTAAAQTPAPRDVGGEGMARPGLPRTAEEVQPWAGRMFTRFDANQDGAITEDELAVLADPTVAGMGGSRMRAMILMSDADGDARITVEELTAGAQRMFERMNSRRGAGGGGGGGGAAAMLTVPRTADAVQPWAQRVFARLDANQDGNITGDELAILASPQVAAMGGSRLRAMIVRSDANRDSRISAEEFSTGAQRMFDRMDRDGDGRLSDEEMPPSPAPPPPMSMPAPEPTNPFPDMPDGG